MSLATLERAIVISARGVLNNPKLRLKDLLEWSTSKVKSREGEVAVYVPDPGAWAVFPKACDKRASHD